VAKRHLDFCFQKVSSMQSNLSKSSRAAVKELKVDWSIIYILELSLTRLKNYRAAILLQNLQQNQLCDSQIQNQIPQLLQLLHRFHSFAIPKYNASASVIPQLLQLCALYFVTTKNKKIVDEREKLRHRDCEITEERELG
jgi:hypothetical protein